MDFAWSVCHFKPRRQHLQSALLTTRSRLTQAGSAYARGTGRRRMWVGDEMKRSGSAAQSNNFRTILLNVLPLFDVFLSLAPSLPAIYHLLPSRSPSSRLQQQLAHTSWLPSSPAPSLTPSFFFYIFFYSHSEACERSFSR